MILYHASKPGTCQKCEKPYDKGTPLLLSDDKKQRLGCANCTDGTVLDELMRLMSAQEGAPAPSQAQPSPTPPPKEYAWAKKRLVWKGVTMPGTCESCGSRVEKGAMAAKWAPGEGGNWQIVRCKSCPDLSPDDRRQFEGRLTSDEQTDPAALAARAGNFVGMWSTIQTLVRSGDVTRLDAATHAFGKWETLYAALSRLALGNTSLAEATELSWLGAWDAACASGFLPGAGPSAMAYLVPRSKIIGFELSYKAYHQLGHRDGVTVTEFVVWACEQVLGLMARPYRDALHAARGMKNHATVILGRIESEANAATYAANIAEYQDDGVQAIDDALTTLQKGGKTDLPQVVVAALRQAVGRDGNARDLACAIAYRLWMATLARAAIDKDEAEVRKAREDAAKANKACTRTYKHDVNDIAIIRALLIPEHLGGWLSYDWYFVHDESRPPLYSKPPPAVWSPPEPEWTIYQKDNKDWRHWTVTPIGVFAIGRWKVLGEHKSAWKWLDIIEVHKRAARGQGPKVEADGSLSAPDGKSPWASDYYAMVWKTADRDLFTHGKLPVSGQTQAIVAIDSNGTETHGDLVEVSQVAGLAQAAIERFRPRRPLQIEDNNAPGVPLEEAAEKVADRIDTELEW